MKIVSIYDACIATGSQSTDRFSLILLFVRSAGPAALNPNVLSKNLLSGTYGFEPVYNMIAATVAPLREQV